MVWMLRHSISALFYLSCCTFYRKLMSLKVQESGMNTSNILRSFWDTRISSSFLAPVRTDFSQGTHSAWVLALLSVADMCLQPNSHQGFKERETGTLGMCSPSQCLAPALCASQAKSTGMPRGSHWRLPAEFQSDLQLPISKVSGRLHLSQEQRRLSAGTSLQPSRMQESSHGMIFHPKSMTI